jgi:hypothetical protein
MQVRIGTVVSEALMGVKIYSLVLWDENVRPYLGLSIEN